MDAVPERALVTGVVAPTTVGWVGLCVDAASGRATRESPSTIGEDAHAADAVFVAGAAVSAAAAVQIVVRIEALVIAYPTETTPALAISADLVAEALPEAVAAVLTVGVRLEAAIGGAALDTGQVRTAVLAAARRARRTAHRDLGRVVGVALDDAKLARVICVALLTDKLAVVDLALVARPRRGAGSAAAGLHWVRLLLALALALALALPFAFALLGRSRPRCGTEGESCREGAG